MKGTSRPFNLLLRLEECMQKWKAASAGGERVKGTRGVSLTSFDSTNASKSGSSSPIGRGCPLRASAQKHPRIRALDSREMSIKTKPNRQQRQLAAKNGRTSTRPCIVQKWQQFPSNWRGREGHNLASIHCSMAVYSRGYTRLLASIRMPGRDGLAVDLSASGETSHHILPGAWNSGFSASG